MAFVQINRASVEYDQRSSGDIVLSDLFEQRVPRYTSYPPATQFKADVGSRDFRSWLSELDKDAAISLYIHVPFCESLCTYCGCHTTITQDTDRVARYADLLRKELALVASTLGSRRRLTHLHWGGGTPTILSPKDLIGLTCAIRYHFDVASDAEVAVEIDPRHLRPNHVEALAAAGITRASLGIQDFEPSVQAAINRVQPIDCTLQALSLLKKVGIGKVNFDLMYGLPLQTIDSVRKSAQTAIALAPSRISLFGYAHVPWMKKHQRLIDETTLPSASDRLEQYRAASSAFVEAGYIAIGLDHFARPDDPLTDLLANHSVHRNFQGYTSDSAPALIGIGASAISFLPQGYAQNAVPLNQYRDSIQAEQFAHVRGLRLTDDDRRRAALIQSLMCYMKADLQNSGIELSEDQRQELAGLEKRGLVAMKGSCLTIPEQMRPFVRTVCAAFDPYVSAACTTRHSLAV